MAFFYLILATLMTTVMTPKNFYIKMNGIKFLVDKNMKGSNTTITKNMKQNKQQ